MKSGDLNKAKEIFDQSQNKTIVMYNTMLNGLSWFNLIMNLK